MLKPILGFLAGVVLTALIAYLVVFPNLQAKNDKLLADQQRSAELMNQAFRNSTRQPFPNWND